MRYFVAFVLILLLPAASQSQARGTSAGGRQTPDSVFTRAIALNNEQRGVEARALVDSMLRVTPTNSPVYGDALFWKGILAETEQVAEESYKKIVVDYPLHRRSEEALIRLSQLEMARGNRVQAQRYLDRIVVEHPYGSFRARASYWRARLFFEENEMDRACAELGTARARLATGDVELRNAIDFAAQRCASVPQPALASRKADSGGPPPGTRAGGRGDSSVAGRSAQRGRGAASGTAGRGATTTRGGTTGKGKSAASDTSAKNAKAAAPTTQYSVQAAAFPLKANAEALVEALKGRGYAARLVGTASPYRVWIGRFATRAEATTLANELKARNISSGAYVVEAERGGGEE